MSDGIFPPRAVQLRVLLGIMLLLIAGCGEKPKWFIRLVVYSPYGREILQDFERQFEALHRNDEIPIDVVSYSIPSQVILQQILVEKSTPHCDVWWGGSSLMFMQAKEEGLLDTCPKAKAAPFVRIDHRDPQYYWMGTFLSPVVIVYNRRKVSNQEAPKDWDDLLDPKWKGKIILRDPVDSEAMQTILATLIYRFFREDNNPNRGYDWLRDLQTNIVTYAASIDNLFAELDSGENATIGLWALPDVVSQRHRYDYDIDYVIPAGGAPILVDGIALIRGSSHMETAQKFIDFITSRKSQLHLAAPANGYYRIPSRTDMQGILPKWLKNVDIDAMIKGMPIDWGVIRKNRAEWIAYWNKNIRTKRSAHSKTSG